MLSLCSPMFHRFKANNHLNLHVIILKNLTRNTSVREQQSFISLLSGKGSAAWSSALTRPGREGAFPRWHTCSITSCKLCWIHNRTYCPQSCYHHVALALPDLDSSLHDSWVLKEDPKGKTLWVVSSPLLVSYLPSQSSVRTQWIPKMSAP
jgi:hypothetical protein